MIQEWRCPDPWIDLTLLYNNIIISLHNLYKNDSGDYIDTADVRRPSNNMRVQSLNAYHWMLLTMWIGILDYNNIIYSSSTFIISWCRVHMKIQYLASTTPNLYKGQPSHACSWLGMPLYIYSDFVIKGYGSHPT